MGGFASYGIAFLLGPALRNRADASELFELVDLAG
jgi:hypothetical protein